MKSMNLWMKPTVIDRVDCSRLTKGSLEKRLSKPEFTNHCLMKLLLLLLTCRNNLPGRCKGVVYQLESELC